VHAIIGDITDWHRLNAVFAEHRPEIVFHAAAHKHVPLMEINPCEAVKNNVIGTRQVAEAADQHGVERMILISSDKAVNPSSVMGATKRVAELMHVGMAARSKTRFMTVRFGNVLGSNGSVVPRFIEQIKAGGPVTVTHPDMKRYFMLIPEAVQLVLHAAAAGEPGAVYVLEMGDQIKLLDMARNIIRLSGFVPDEEIPIVFTGLRLGEKLAEELVGHGESAERTSVTPILQVRTSVTSDQELLAREIGELERLALGGNTAAVIDKMCRIVPTFTPEAVSHPTDPTAPGRQRVAAERVRMPAALPAAVSVH
jgi:FlaA1/EpsC-like NDP-sugar epimerase